MDLVHGCGVPVVVTGVWVQLELLVELGFGFYWVRVSFFFSSDSRARAELGKSREQHARKFLPARLFL